MSFKQSNKIIKDKILSDFKNTPQEEQATLIQSIQGQMKDNLHQTGNQRFFKPDEIDTITWKEIFKDSSDEIEVDVTGENVDKDAMTSLNTLLMYIAKKQGQPFSPEEKLIFNKILIHSGVVSPLELSTIPPAPPTQPVQSPMQPTMTPPVPTAGA